VIIKDVTLCVLKLVTITVYHVRVPIYVVHVCLDGLDLIVVLISMNVLLIMVDAHTIAQISKVTIVALAMRDTV
jgi:hypothetical protein